MTEMCKSRRSSCPVLHLVFSIILDYLLVKCVRIREHLVVSLKDTCLAPCHYQIILLILKGTWVLQLLHLVKGRRETITNTRSSSASCSCPWILNLFLHSKVKMMQLIIRNKDLFQFWRMKNFLESQRGNIHTLESILQEQPAGCAQHLEAFNCWTESNWSSILVKEWTNCYSLMEMTLEVGMLHCCSLLFLPNLVNWIHIVPAHRGIPILGMTD